MKNCIKDQLFLPALAAGLCLILPAQLAGQSSTALQAFTTLHAFSAAGYDGDNPYAVLVLSGNTLYGTAYDGGNGYAGTVFKVNTDGTGYTTLYSFSQTDANGFNSDGANPQAGLVLSGNTLYGTALYGGSAGAGTVFKVNTDGSGFASLYSFSQTDANGFNSDGANPQAGLILSGNTLYGTALYGGSAGAGTVFKVNTDGTGFGTLYSFTYGDDGANPQAGLILSGNTLYGTAVYGGNAGMGTVFAVNTNGTGFATLHGFTNASDNSDGAYPQAGLILSGNTLYGTAAYGGSLGYGAVFKVNTDGTGCTSLYSFTNGNDGAYPYAGLILSGSTLYGTAYNGGSAGDGTVFKVNTDGSGFASLYSFSQTDASGFNSDGAVPQAGLILSGNTLYGTTFYGGSTGSGTVFAVNTNGTGFATLHDFAQGYANSDGAFPSGLIISGNTLYGTANQGGSSGNGTVFAINTDGTGLTTLHNFTYGSDGADPQAGLILSGNTLYGTTAGGGSSGRGTVFKVNTDGSGFATLYSFSQTDANGLNSDGASPQAGLILSGNTLYGTAAEGGSANRGTVFKVNTDGSGFTMLHSFSKTGTYGYNSDGAYPSAGLVISGNTVYGTAAYGGSSGNGTVFAVNTDGTGFKTLHNFTYGSDGAYPQAGLILSGNTLYGTARDGGSGYSGTAFKVNTDGTGWTTLYSFSETDMMGFNSDGAYPQAGLILSGSTLYGTAAYGGSTGDGTVFKVNTDGSGFVSLYSFSQAAGSFSQPGMNGYNSDGAFPQAGLVFSGNFLYGTAYSGGSAGNGTVFSINITPPSITSQPAPTVTILQGQALTLQVGAGGPGPFTYQWMSNGVPLAEGGNVYGAAAANLVITPAFTNNTGSYWVMVSNPGGSTNSAPSVVTVKPGTLGQQYSLGLNYLAASNVPSALSSFTAAVGASPTDGAANVYLALTRLLALPNDSTATAFLTGLGIPTAGRNIYNWQARPKTNSHGGLVVSSSLTADQFTAEMRNDIVPTLIAAEANLAQITDTNFGLFLPRSVTHFGDVTIDYGDVQMFRAILDAGMLFGYTLHTANLNAPFGTVSNIVATQKSVGDVLNTFPGLLTLTNAGDLSLARGAFTNGISRYMMASQFIRSRRAGVRFFNLVTNDLQDEQNFRLLLTDLESSLNAPFGGPGAAANAIPGAAFYNVISAFTDHTVSLANLFNGNFNLRSLLPALGTNRFTFIWDKFPDTTLGGVITGLTQTNLDNAFLKVFHAQAQLNTPGVTCTVLSSAPNSLQGSLNGVVQGTDGNFYGTVPYGGDIGYGAFFRATAGGGFTLLYSFGEVTNADGSPMDGGNPSSLAVGTDGNFYGTTQFGGTNGNGTIFKLIPGATIATRKTVYNFGDQDDGSFMGGNPLLLAKGNFYGTTQFGGDNGAGVIFEFTPPSGSGGGEGTFTTLASFPSSSSSSPNGNGAGAGALVQGTDGYFYGVTQFGGDNGSGSIFQFIPGSGANGPQLNTLYSFPQMTDQYGDPIILGINTLVQGTNGVFYGTTQYGGGNVQNSSSGEGDGAIFSIDTNRNFATLYSFDENNFDGFGPIGAMVQGANGAFYGITSSGGADGDGTIFQFTPGAAPAFVVWFDQGLGEQQNGQNGYYGMYNFNAAVGLTKGAAGTFYGTTSQGGPVKHANGTVFSLTLNANYPASIVNSPLSTTTLAGNNVTLTVSASGTLPLHYLWKRIGGPALPGNASGYTTSNLTFTVLTTNDTGSYFVVVSNPYGSATSAAALLTVLQGPTITSQPATPVSLVQGQALSLKVGAGGPGPLTYQWLANNMPLSNGGSVSGAATSNLVIFPVVTGNTASYSVIVSNSNAGISSKASVVTVSVDKGAPVVAISSPAASGGRSNAPVMFRGTAVEALTQGNVPITSVNYWITNFNGATKVQGPFAAVLTAGTSATAPSNWTASVSTPAGSNVFAVQSRNFSGTNSPVKSLNFFLQSPSALTLITNAGNGNGSVKVTSSISGEKVPASGSPLYVGEGYSIAATTGANCFFSNWAGGSTLSTMPYTNLSGNASYSFIMESNLVLEANFITNIFMRMTGIYNGLFSADAVWATEETAGYIYNLKVSNQGVYSATVNLDGASPAISGTLTHDGNATNVVFIPAEKYVKVVLHVNVNSAPGVARTITATVTGTNTTPGWTSIGTLVASASLAATSLDAGRYVLLIPPSQQPLVTNPPGYGYMLLTNNPGTASVPPYVTITGALADGTGIISQTVPIGEDNGIPIYQNPYTASAPGLLFGRLYLSNSVDFPPPWGNLTWIKKASSAGLFKAGFTNPPMAVQGSPWTPSSVPLTSFFIPGSQLVVSNGGLTAPLDVRVYLVNNTNLVPQPNGIPNFKSGSINTNTGQLTVTFTNGFVRTGKGVILQDSFQSLYGGGFFIMSTSASSSTPTNVGSITLMQQ